MLQCIMKLNNRYSVPWSQGTMYAGFSQIPELIHSEHLLELQVLPLRPPSKGGAWEIVSSTNIPVILKIR